MSFSIHALSELTETLSRHFSKHLILGCEMSIRSVRADAC
jgi:hypothetical protein